MTDQPDTRLDPRHMDILTRIKDAACPNCRRYQAQMLLSNSRFTTYAIERDRLGEWPADYEPRDLETLKIACTWCGYIREFVLDVLLTAPDEADAKD